MKQIEIYTDSSDSDSNLTNAKEQHETDLSNESPTFYIISRNSDRKVKL